MNIRLALFLSLIAIGSVFADDQVARVQQQLKDQGFYYGEITGEKNADTTAAIRRFQIRSGLQITGELNDETGKALATAASTASTPNKSIAAATPAPAPRASLPPANTREDSERYPEEDEQAPRYAPQPSQDRQVPPPVYPGRPAPQTGGYFARTPYESAPPEVQQDLIGRAQRTLAKRDLYRGAVDGVLSPDLEFSLRAYQSRVGLQPTGRLDLETLAALELLPGANQPVFIPPRRAYREPPVRGEWVRP
jgi:peptidoglycan hydrolase-like protein with peptidoglycan-binding domain